MKGGMLMPALYISSSLVYITQQKTYCMYNLDKYRVYECLPASNAAYQSPSIESHAIAVPLLC
jgi:hypothetical protein